MANDKKKKKEEKAKPVSQKHYNTLTVEKVKAHELKYTQRLMELRACLILIDGKLNEFILMKANSNIHSFLELWETLLIGCRCGKR